MPASWSLPVPTGSTPTCSPVFPIVRQSRYATRVRIELEPVKEFVALRHVRYRNLRDLQQGLAQIVADGTYQGTQVDYLDGVVFSATESYLTVGTRTDDPGPTSDYTGQQIYYRSLQQRQTDRLSTADYLWRWDTDWFWCSRAFGAQSPTVRRLWPKRLRRSSFYWKLVALDRRLGIADRIERLHGRPPQERVVQDVEVPVESTAPFLEWFLEHIPIEPIWLCPLRVRHSATGPRSSPLYPLAADQTYVNIGFWSAVASIPGEVDHAANRAVEDQVSAVGGHKSLYSDAFYPADVFDRLYGGSTFRTLKQRYDPDGRLLGMYEKTVGRQ